jgi:signal transduction histidine kinase
VWADPDQINFILRNLVHNAIKYSSAGEEVTINAHNEGSRCLIEIIDTGEGISKETLDTLYGYKPMITKVGTAGEEGTGLGLRICLEFAQLNRGEIKIKNNPAGRGTCFTISLPSQQA